MEKRVPKGRKMWTVQIDENGGVQIPKEALALIGLKAGESAVLTGDKRRRVGACGRKPRGIGAGSLFEKRRISLAQRNSLRLFFTEICVPVLRAAGCGAAVSGESEAAQEERALGI